MARAAILHLEVVSLLLAAKRCNSELLWGCPQPAPWLAVSCMMSPWQAAKEGVVECARPPHRAPVRKCQRADDRIAPALRRDGDASRPA